MPRVSVIIPTHNRVDLLIRAVTSVLKQSFSDLEVVIVDDASTDRTAELVRAIADARVKYVRHEKNRGVSAARNTALGRATGEFMAFLDDDDEWLPEKTRLQIQRFEEVGPMVGLMCGGHHVIDSATNAITGEVIPTQRGQLFERMLRQGYLSHTSTIMARAECFARVGLFDETVNFGEDFDMWLRIAKEYEVDFVATPVARRHFLDDGLTRNIGGIVVGTEAHLLKYREFFAKNPDAFSERLRKLGTYYCFAGEMRLGRNTFYRAIAQRPFEIKSYVGAVLSWMGPRAFRAVYAMRNNLSEPSPETAAKRS